MSERVSERVSEQEVEETGVRVRDQEVVGGDPEDPRPLFDRVRRPIKWVGPSEWRPRRTYRGDAGYDLFVAKGAVVEPGEFVDVPCGVQIELPEGVWALITGRSSTLRKRRLLVAQGVIDNGYRGPLFAGVQNLSNEAVAVKAGERLAQLIPFSVLADELMWLRVRELGDSPRGDNGFGSTGT